MTRAVGPTPDRRLARRGVEILDEVLDHLLERHLLAAAQGRGAELLHRGLESLPQRRALVRRIPRLARGHDDAAGEAEAELLLHVGAVEQFDDLRTERGMGHADSLCLCMLRGIPQWREITTIYAQCQFSEYKKKSTDQATCPIDR